jgi:hypothetical protein
MEQHSTTSQKKKDGLPEHAAIPQGGIRKGRPEEIVMKQNSPPDDRQ